MTTNYLYYRNMFLKYIKTKDYQIYKKLTNILTLKKLDELFITCIPEHYMWAIYNDYNKFGDFFDDFYSDNLTDWLIYVSKHTKKEHRILAKQTFLTQLILNNITENEINERILHFRQNKNFRKWKDTILDDKYNKNIDELCNNAPIGLIPFYSFRYEEDLNYRNKMNDIDNEWREIVKNIYYGENNTE